ncbi:M15 family metallopeptidase domain-containing protein [Lentzea nigeriaca]|uniref:hypothetical protein n=1 Tax=Lentzea nigeriaca TaxID=1128665 RepID=UPI001956E29F|nr:hypothetical protein [Lentzea nigeriaca]MBM7865072.1 hypothetical protein [Lentzea nigeriaca]
MTILLADPVLRAVRVLENGDPLAPLVFAPDVLVRQGLALRLVDARDALPSGVDLRVIEGHRSIADQNAIIERYTGDLRELHPSADAVELDRAWHLDLQRRPGPAPGVRVIEHGDVDLPAREHLLDEHPVVAAAGPIAAVLTIVAAALSRRYVEEPVMRRGSRSPAPATPA